MTSPSFLAHDDVRVAAILALGQYSAEFPHMTDAPFELAVAAMLPNLPHQQVMNAFRLVAADLFTAVDMDSRGAEAVRETFGAWSDSYMSADDKATELRDEARQSARLAAEMLVSTSDALAVR